MPTEFNPRRLDVAAFAEAQAALDGAEALHGFARLAHDCSPGPDTPAVTWQARGTRRALAGAGTLPALHLRVQASLPLTCQVCLGEVSTPVQVDRHFVFVADEATAAHLDEDSEEADVLVLARDFDLYALIEDELLMALPLAPRHAQCPRAVPMSAQDEGFDTASARPNPFAALAALKREASGGGGGPVH